MGAFSLHLEESRKAVGVTVVCLVVDEFFEGEGGEFKQPLAADEGFVDFFLQLQAAGTRNSEISLWDMCASRSPYNSRLIMAKF